MLDNNGIILFKKLAKRREKMLDDKKIKKFFKLLNLKSEKDREKILCQGVIEPQESEEKPNEQVVLDNVTSTEEEGEIKNAELE